MSKIDTHGHNHFFILCVSLFPTKLTPFQSLQSSLSTLAGVLNTDLEIARQLLHSVNEMVPTQVQQDLASIFVDLQPVFTDVCRISSERTYVLEQAIEIGKVSVEISTVFVVIDVKIAESCIICR